jgi:hypothetical protein
VPFDEQISQPSKLPEPTKAPKAPNTHPRPSKSTRKALIQAKPARIMLYNSSVIRRKGSI